MDSVDGGCRRFSASVCVSTTSGLSPVTLRRANSDKMKNPRIPIIIIPQDNLLTDLNGKSSLQRTPSMDILDDRMNQSVRNSMQDIDYSSEDDTPEGVLSPHQCMQSIVLYVHACIYMYYNYTHILFRSTTTSKKQLQAH